MPFSAASVCGISVYGVVSYVGCARTMCQLLNTHPQLSKQRQVIPHPRLCMTFCGVRARLKSSSDYILRGGQLNIQIFCLNSSNLCCRLQFRNTISPMKFPTFPTIIRTLYSFSNFSTSATTRHKALQPLTRGTVLKSMPTIPFLSSFFSTSNSSKMSYPLQKSDDEWQAVLSKGMSSSPR
jgi:hypothetical protein